MLLDELEYRGEVEEWRKASKWLGKTSRCFSGFLCLETILIRGQIGIQFYTVADVVRMTTRNL